MVEEKYRRNICTVVVEFLPDTKGHSEGRLAVEQFRQFKSSGGDELIR